MALYGDFDKFWWKKVEIAQSSIFMFSWNVKKSKAVSAWFWLHNLAERPSCASQPVPTGHYWTNRTRTLALWKGRDTTKTTD